MSEWIQGIDSSVPEVHDSFQRKQGAQVKPSRLLQAFASGAALKIIIIIIILLFQHLVALHFATRFYSFRMSFPTWIIQILDTLWAQTPKVGTSHPAPLALVHWHSSPQTPAIPPKFNIPSWELTYPPKKALLKMIFLFPRWDMLVPWRVAREK